jgi:capsular polysaccharide biosynthesis protein
MSVFRRTTIVAPECNEPGPAEGDIEIDPKFLERHASWIGPMSGSVPAVHLLEADNVSVTALAYYADSSGSVFTDERLQPAHLRSYVIDNKSEIERSHRELKRHVMDAPSFYFASTKNVFGHWLLEMFPAILLYKEYLAPLGVRLILWDETLPAYIDFITQVIGIDLGQIDLLPLGREVVTFKKLHSAEMFHDDSYLFNGHFGLMIKKMAGWPSLAEPKHRIFISRARFQSKTWRPGIVDGIEALEEMMESAGFTIAYPEEMSIQRQISMFANASHICGMAGSGLHSSIFMKPRTKVVSIGFNHVQVKLCVLRGQKIKHVMPNGARSVSASSIDNFDARATFNEITSFIEPA